MKVAGSKLSFQPRSGRPLLCISSPGSLRQTAASHRRSPVLCVPLLHPRPTLALGLATRRWRASVLTHAIMEAPGGTLVVEKTFSLSKGGSIQVMVEESGGDQILRLRAIGLQAGRLLLHWGVEGGKGYKGGWRLPGHSVRPEGTTQYKDRALQSPFRESGDALELVIQLDGDEVSDVLNFVLKDDATNTWWDCNGSNFTVPLRSGASATGSNAASVVLPKDLCDKWAWVCWDFNGRPNRSEAEAQHEYDIGVKEMKQLLFQGRPLDELWQVADGYISYRDYRKKHLGSNAAPAPPTPLPATPEPSTPVKPSAPVEPVKQEDIGQSMGTPSRNPLDMIKRSGPTKAPVLSEDKRPAPVQRPLDYLVEEFALDPSTKWRRVFQLQNKSQMLAVVRQESMNSMVRVDIITDIPDDVVLHWGVSRHGKRDWSMPPEEYWPEETVTAGHIAVETDFLNCDDDECDVDIAVAKVPLQRMTLLLPPDHKIGAITFVLRSADHTMWYKDAGSNFFIPVPSRQQPELEPPPADPCADFNDGLSRAIIDSEVKSGAWTLMHRFNRAADLLNEVLEGYFEDIDVADATARIFVWLRYSSTRHLTWQRNYNTQPRILSAAQGRLTQKIADAHSRLTGEAQEWVRLMLTTVGRGGDGQKIRDEILHIMHRNNIKEMKGIWMEEWHQKLHNNTTPDDVPICEAYLAFLEANGNRDAYWRVLSDNGITRERLEGYDRAITLEPEFYGDKKDALIHDFRNYLGILKAVHSGADLQASAAAAGNRIPGDARGYLGYVMGHLNDSQLLPLMEAAVEARIELHNSMTGCKELLYLDLALEDKIRQVAERGAGAAGFGAAAFMKPLLQNLILSLGNNEEICYCLKTWLEMPSSVRNGGRPSKEEALKAVAVVGRIRRALAEISDSIMHRIGDISAAYGRAFGVEEWAYELFAEEVVRGGPAFAVSLVISSIEPALRNAAALGDWQVISPHEAVGVIEAVDDLSSVQDKTYHHPTVLIAQQVTGEEEIPEGVVAVLTPDAPDVLSHVSVRARNMKVLFATCHDPAPLENLRQMAGKEMHFSTTASGSVTWSEPVKQAPGQAATKESKIGNLKIDVPKWSGRWTVPIGEYEDGVCGAKSKNLQKLQGKLPDWIQLPSSFTLPFGCFEEVLDLPENAELKAQISNLVQELVNKRVDHHDALVSVDFAMFHMDGQTSTAAELLSQCRNLAMKVKLPPNIRQELTAAMKAAGHPVPDSESRWGQAEEALKGVWASKYNDRAYYSMRKVGLNFDDVRMAVLVQRVVPAQYAFVIHTKNPSNNDENEIFCEMVRGLGESLVSGMVAGSAIAFKATKDALDNPEVLCYASKSEAMFVPESLIFRSDSNGEDLEGYAGAGLYESITMDPTVTKRIDYMDDKLVQDEGYRRELMARICKVGHAIETALGSAQDIEGVVAPDGTITVVQTRPQV